MNTLVERLDDRVREGEALLSFHGTGGEPPTRLTYGEIVAHGERVAGLVEEPVAEGERVVLILPQGPALHGAFFAALWHGLVPSVLAYPTFKMSRDLYRAQLAALSRHLGAARIVTTEEVGAILAGLPVRVAPAAAPPSGARPSCPAASPAPTEVAFLQHSAGTTGLQKGVALSHGAVLLHVDDYARALEVGPEDRVASWLPLYHDMGLIACLVMPMTSALPSVTMSPTEWVMRPGSILQVMAAEGSTLAWWPNFTFPFLAKRASKQEAASPLEAIRKLVNCSEPVTRGAFDAFLDRFRSSGAREDQMHASYAMAENTFAVTQTRTSPTTTEIDRDAFSRRGEVVPVASGSGVSWTSSGPLCGANELRVVSEDGSDLPDGRVGELFVRSPYMLSGYFGRPDLTEAAIAAGWYRTGDLGFVHQGEVYVTGRKRDLVIVGGINLYPQDIEEVAGRDPDVHDGRVVAVGIRDDVAGTEDLVVAVETHGADRARGPEASEIAARVRRAVTGAFDVAPRHVLVVPPMWLLKSSAGKISRSRNREKIAEILLRGGSWSSEES